jgi:hypothetical protein
MTIADHHLPETLIRLPVIVLVCVVDPPSSTSLDSPLHEITPKFSDLDAATVLLGRDR